MSDSLTNQDGIQFFVTYEDDEWHVVAETSGESECIHIVDCWKAMDKYVPREPLTLEYYENEVWWSGFYDETIADLAMVKFAHFVRLDDRPAA